MGGCFCHASPFSSSSLSSVLLIFFTTERRDVLHNEEEEEEEKTQRKGKIYIFFLYTSSKANWRTMIKQTRGSICSRVCHFSLLFVISSLIIILVTILLRPVLLLSASLILHRIRFSRIFKINLFEPNSSSWLTFADPRPCRAIKRIVPVMVTIVHSTEIRISFHHCS